MRSKNSCKFRTKPLKNPETDLYIPIPGKSNTDSRKVPSRDTRYASSSSSSPTPRFTNSHVNPKLFGSSRDRNRLREDLSEARHRDSYCQLCSVEYGIFHP